MDLNNLVGRAVCACALLGGSLLANQAQADGLGSFARAKNVIFFVGDGMGVSTVTATRVYSVGVDGELVLDEMPFVALSRTSSTDHVTPDSAATMTSMMSGVNTNSGLIGYGPDTERQDFNNDGNGFKPWTVLEQAEQRGMRTGVISTARITHATPAATYAHVTDRNFETDIAAQALPTDPSYNERLGNGIDLLFGGGRRFFCPSGSTDEEGSGCSRTDGRDLRQEFQDAGYTYIWNQTGFNGLIPHDLPVLGLFESSHMEYEQDRSSDLGGEPSLSEMTGKAIDLLSASTGGSSWRSRRNRDKGYFLMVEAGRIDHAHHAGNAYRAIIDTEELDKAVEVALQKVDLRDTLIVVTADHSHVFSIAGYGLRPPADLPYATTNYLNGYHDDTPGDSGILDVVYDIDTSGQVFRAGDSDGVPYTQLVYGNGPGYRIGARIDPATDGAGPEDPDYLQEAAVPIGSETHAAEEVAIYAAGPQSWLFQGTVRNAAIAQVMRRALGMNDPN